MKNPITALTVPEITTSVSYLNSRPAIEALEADIYWPKWNAPWWHMMLLWEMGLADTIPKELISLLIKRLSNSPYVQFFPTSEDQVSNGLDVSRHTFCHCHLGSVYQVLHACDIDVDTELPWIRPWFLKYQLPDGGLNCENEAYGKQHPKSSIVSSLPPLEAILYCTNRNFTDAETRFLDLGAEYLLSYNLCHRKTRPQLYINESFLQVCFPRFYHYDILRGLRFVTEWSNRLNRPLPKESIAETVDLLQTNFPDGRILNQRVSFEGETTLAPDDKGNWTRGHTASLFPLLIEVSKPGVEAPALTRLWSVLKNQLK